MITDAVVLIWTTEGRQQPP